MRYVLSLMAIAFLASPGIAEEAKPAVNSAITSIQTSEDKTQRMTVPVMINGTGPYQFVIDTGSDTTVISSELAERLGLETAGKARIQAMNGVAQGRMVKVKSLSISNTEQTNFKAPAIPRENLGADGLLGINNLAKLRITIDFDGREILVEPGTAPLRPKPPNSEEIIVQTRSRLGQMVMIDADAGQEKIWAIVDTGGETTIANPALRRMLVKNQRVKSLKPVTITDVMGLQGVADYAMIERIRIGGLVIGKSNVAFLNANPFKLFKLQKRPAMMIGMATLRAFRRVTIDFVRRRVIFVLPR